MAQSNALGHRLHDVCLAPVDELGGAELPGLLELRVVDVDNHDRVGTGEPRTHDGRQPDAARAHDQQGAPDALADHVEHGTDARNDGAARDRGDPGRHAVGHGDDRFLDTTTCSAKLETPIRWYTSRPSSRRRVVPSSGSPFVLACTFPSSHITGCPITQYRQRPQRGRHSIVTRSPGATDSTPSPTASTVPLPSWPTTIGSRHGRSPVI